MENYGCVGARFSESILKTTEKVTTKNHVFPSFPLREKKSNPQIDNFFKPLLSGDISFYYPGAAAGAGLLGLLDKIRLFCSV